MRRGNLCGAILLCKDRSLPLWMWSSNSYSTLLLTDLWLWPNESWAHTQPCLMPWWLQAEVWDVLTGLDLREKPETVVRNNGAGAAPLGNTHKYVHGTAHHSDNKPAHSALWLFSETSLFQILDWVQGNGGSDLLLQPLSVAACL